MNAFENIPQGNNTSRVKSSVLPQSPPLEIKNYPPRIDQDYLQNLTQY